MTAQDFEKGQAELKALADWWVAQGNQDRNEATTRLHLINGLIHGALGWPKGLVVAEESHAGKYTDYSIGRPATRLIVEAKREGVYFDLPVGVGPGVMNLSTLFSVSPDFEAAARQAMGYCHERGVPLAAVCNGHQLVAFLASRQDGVPPLEGRALVFESPAAMLEAFPLLWNTSLRTASRLARSTTRSAIPLCRPRRPNYRLEFRTTPATGRETAFRRSSRSSQILYWRTSPGRLNWKKSSCVSATRPPTHSLSTPSSAGRSLKRATTP